MTRRKEKNREVLLNVGDLVIYCNSSSGDNEIDALFEKQNVVDDDYFSKYRGIGIVVSEPIIDEIVGISFVYYDVRWALHQKVTRVLSFCLKRLDEARLI
jgi:hypothetical protein